MASELMSPRHGSQRPSSISAGQQNQAGPGTELQQGQQYPPPLEAGVWKREQDDLPLQQQQGQGQGKKRVRNAPPPLQQRQGQPSLAGGQMREQDGQPLQPLQLQYQQEQQPSLDLLVLGAALRNAASRCGQEGGGGAAPGDSLDPQLYQDLLPGQDLQRSRLRSHKMLEGGGGGDQEAACVAAAAGQDGITVAGRDRGVGRVVRSSGAVGASAGAADKVLGSEPVLGLVSHLVSTENVAVDRDPEGGSVGCGPGRGPPQAGPSDDDSGGVASDDGVDHGIIAHADGKEAASSPCGSSMGLFRNQKAHAAEQAEHGIGGSPALCAAAEMGSPMVAVRVYLSSPLQVGGDGGGEGGESGGDGGEGGSGSEEGGGGGGKSEGGCIENGGGGGALESDKCCLSLDLMDILSS